MFRIFGVAAALFHVSGYLMYNAQSRKGESRPNLVSWSVWFVCAILNAFTFRSMTGNWFIPLQFFAGSVACIVTFIHWLLAKKFSLSKRNLSQDLSCFGLALLACFVWWRYRAAGYANVIIMTAVAISFIPTFMGVLRNPWKERPLPWWLWTLASGFTTAAVILNRKPAIALVAPVFLVIGHGVIAILADKRRKLRFTGGMR